MKYAYAYVCGSIGIVIVGAFMMYYFSVYQSYSDMTPQFSHDSQRQYVDVNKARELAERSVDQLKMILYGYRFDNIIYDWGYSPNGTKELKDIRVFYQSPNPSAGAISITEDP